MQHEERPVEADPLSEAAREIVGVVAELEWLGMGEMADRAARVAGLIAIARAGRPS